MVLSATVQNVGIQNMSNNSNFYGQGKQLFSIGLDWGFRVIKCDYCSLQSPIAYDKKTGKNVESDWLEIGDGFLTFCPTCKCLNKK